MTTTRFIQPIDVLFFRGNRLFGDAGSVGDMQMPPSPSVLSGAVRSLLLSHSDTSFADFAAGKLVHPVLGTPQEPGAFAVQHFGLAKMYSDGSAEPIYPLPADWVAATDPTYEKELATAPIQLNSLKPQKTIPSSAVNKLHTSYPLAALPILRQNARGKPVEGIYITKTGMQKALSGSHPDSSDCLRSNDIWQTELRVGIGLSADKRSANDGQLFSMHAIAMQSHKDYSFGFCMSAAGCDDVLPRVATLRLGGDGRAATLTEANFDWPDIALDQVIASRRCRIVLTSPGIFQNGWRLPGMGEDNRIEMAGFKARVVAGCVPRSQVISGFDMAKGMPKPAQRAVSAGSVYWLDEIESSADALKEIQKNGLWGEQLDKQRRAEGYNRFLFGLWPDSDKD